MPHIKTVFATAALAWAMTGPARATPVVIDPNFDETPTSAGTQYYGIAAWNAVVLPQSDPAYNPSFAGSVGFDAFNQWNNGAPGNGMDKVGFLANGGAYIYQAISGFSVGSTYWINLVANGRIIDAATPTMPMAMLTITSSSSGTLYSADVPPVDLAQTRNHPFTPVATAMFTANAPTVTVRLANTGGAASTILISGFSISEFSRGSADVSVPEPIGMAVLGAGLLGLAIARRQRPSSSNRWCVGISYTIFVK